MSMMSSAASMGPTPQSDPDVAFEQRTRTRRRLLVPTQPCGYRRDVLAELRARSRARGLASSSRADE